MALLSHFLARRKMHIVRHVKILLTPRCLPHVNEMKGGCGLCPIPENDTTKNAPNAPRAYFFNMPKNIPSFSSLSAPGIFPRKNIQLAKKSCVINIPTSFFQHAKKQGILGTCLKSISRRDVSIGKQFHQRKKNSAW